MFTQILQRQLTHSLETTQNPSIAHYKSTLFLPPIIKNKMQCQDPKLALRNQSLMALPKRNRGPNTKNFKTADITSNHFKVQLAAIKKIVVFRVKIAPQIALDNRKQRQEIFAKIMPGLKSWINSPIISGMNIYSKEEPTNKEQQFKTDQHTINVKQVKVFNITQNPNLLLLFLNNALRNIMSRLNFMEIGKTGKFFQTQNPIKIQSLNLYSGYKATFVQLDGGVYLRVDSAKKVVSNQTVINIIDRLYKIHNDKSKQERRQLLKTQLVGKIVMTNYGKSRYHKIEDVDFTPVAQITLDSKGTTMVSYYKDKYNVTIQNLKQPLLKVEDKKKKEGQGPTLILPELCLMTGIPDDFDQRRRKQISHRTIKQAFEKFNEITDFMSKQVSKESDLKELRELGLDISTQLTALKARVIPVPKLQLGSKQCVQQGKQAFFNLFAQPIFDAKHDVPCAIISSQNADIRPVKDLFLSTSQKLQVKLSLKEYAFQRPDIKEIMANISRADRHDSRICLIVLPDRFKNDYKKIKQFALTLQSKNGGQMLTQVMLQGSLRKKNPQSVFTKILLQIIAKRGNTLWTANPSQPTDKVMLCAFDSSKHAKGSVIASSATLNSSFTSLSSTYLDFQDLDQKLRRMVELTLKSLTAYNGRNKCYPKQTVLFMNSCAGSQIKMYEQHFYQPLMNSINQLGCTTGVTVVMVNLLTSERFFDTRNGVENVQAGLLVCDDIVSPNYDFYLVSQRSNRGCSVPNHYRVVFSNSKMEEALLQEIVFSQCFNYVNWTGSIKVPGVCQYAKKCAKFAAEVMEGKQAPQGLEGKLYFV